MSGTKTFWLINQYASTPETGMAGRHYYLAKELARQGHTVYIIAAGFTHLLRQPPVLNKEFMIQQISENFSFVWVNMPAYENAHDKRRIFNWFRFAWKISKLPKVIPNTPNTILYSSPSLIPFLGAWRLAKKIRAKLAFEVRDIWPLTLIEVGGYSPKHPFIRLMQSIEDKAYRKSDLVLSNLPYAVEHMVSRGMNRDKFTWIPNGLDFNEYNCREPLSDHVYTILPMDTFIVGYTGTMGMANSLDTLIKAAELLKDETGITFVLVGDGREKSNLLEQAKGLRNVYFIDSIPKKQIHSMLSRFNVCYIGWRKEPIYRFGIAANKLAEYMSSGKPIVHAYSGQGDLVAMSNSGISVEAENPQGVADAILRLKNMLPQELDKLGENGRLYALENHDYSRLAEKYARVLS